MALWKQYKKMIIVYREWTLDLQEDKRKDLNNSISENNMSSLYLFLPKGIK